MPKLINCRSCTGFHQEPGGFWYKFLRAKQLVIDMIPIRSYSSILENVTFIPK